MITFFETSLFFGVSISLIAYFIGVVIKRRVHLAILNPLLVAVVLVIIFINVFNIKYDTYNEGAKYISYLLTPATVCLAVPLYEQLKLLRKNIKAVILGILSGILANILGIFFLSKLFGFTHELYVTLLPKSITTAIGMGVSSELGGIVTITVAAITITGILGNVIAEGVFKIFGIKEPVAKGLALGNSAHAVGTAKAMELGTIEGAMSSLAIAVAGLLTVLTASVFAQMM